MISGGMTVLARDNRIIASFTESLLPGSPTLPVVEPLRIGKHALWPPVLLAPMAGETGSVLRILCRRQGAGLVCTELTSSEGLSRGSRRSMEFLSWTDEERPISAQIYGANPEVMADAARTCRDAGADLIDINMGCWVPKVAKTGAGASLLKDLSRAAAVMSAVVNATELPVTIKTRVGWDGCIGSAVEMAKVAQDCGVAAIAIHGRTAIQGFTGIADWTPIAEAKASVRIPVVGNGDVRTPADAARLFAQTGCDAVMIGRQALGYPWIFREVNAFLLDGVELLGPTPAERVEMAREHARLTAHQAHGDHDASTPMPAFARGQLGHYMARIRGAADARRRMHLVETLGDVESILDRLLEQNADVADVPEVRDTAVKEPACANA